MTATANPIMDVLNQSQAGALIATLGIACELNEAQCREAMERLTPEIARRIAERTANKEAFEDLLDILDEEEQVEYLDNPKEMLGRDIINDGEDLLELLYGSLDNARDTAVQLGAPDGVPEETFVRLMTMAAALTLAAMARRNQQFQLSTAGRTAGESSSGSDEGFLAMLVSAIITGLMQGLQQAVRPRRRRRRKRSILEQVFGTRRQRSSRTKMRRRTRRRKSPSLNDLLGDLLRG